MQDNSRSTAIFLLILLSLIWGTSFILIKQGLKVFSPDQVGALRVSVGWLCLLPSAISNWKEVKPGDHWKLFLSGMMGIFIPAFLFATAQTRMASSVAGMLNTLTPIFTMLIGAILFNLRFKALAIVGIVLGFLGTLLLSLSRTGGSISGINIFALFIVLACFLYGCNLNFIKYKIPDLRSITITSVSLFLTGHFAVVYLFVFTDFTARMVEVPGAWKALGYLTILGGMGTAFATVLFNKLVKLSTPLFASSVTYIIPIVAVFWGFMDQEELLPLHFVSMAAIIGGVYLANRKK